MLRGALAQLLMRRRGRRNTRCTVMHFRHFTMGAREGRGWRDAGDGGGKRGGGRERGRKKKKGKCKVPVGDTSNGALLKLHHVAGQGPRLVRENVFHLYEENKEIHLIAGWLLIPLGGSWTETSRSGYIFQYNFWNIAFAPPKWSAFNWP